MVSTGARVRGHGGRTIRHVYPALFAVEAVDGEDRPLVVERDDDGLADLGQERGPQRGNLVHV